MLATAGSGIDSCAIVGQLVASFFSYFFLKPGHSGLEFTHEKATASALDHSGGPNQHLAFIGRCWGRLASAAAPGARFPRSPRKRLGHACRRRGGDSGARISNALGTFPNLG